MAERTGIDADMAASQLLPSGPELHEATGEGMNGMDSMEWSRGTLLHHCFTLCGQSDGQHGVGVGNNVSGHWWMGEVRGKHSAAIEGE